jgi:hypothetical protein
VRVGADADALDQEAPPRRVPAERQQRAAAQVPVGDPREEAECLLLVRSAQ